MNTTVNTTTVGTQPTTVQPVAGIQTASMVATPVVNTVAAGAYAQPVNIAQIPNVNNYAPSDVKKDNLNSNIYLIVGFFVGFVLLVAGFLLFLLLTGVIGGRNRLTFIKTVTGEGYTHVAQRYYKFEGDVYTQVHNVDTFTFTSLTDEEYNIKFDKIINNETNGITEYGFGTQISRDGNIVTITSYNPNFFGEKKEDVLENNKREGFIKE